MNSILGLDLSLSGTGWSVSTGSDIKTGVITPGRKLAGVERLLCLREKLVSVILENHLRGRCSAFVEEYAFSASGRTFGIGEWGGIARCVLADWGIDVWTVSPGTLKKFVTSKGNVDKNQILLGVYRRWGVEFQSDDAADSYALCRLGRLHQKMEPDGKPWDQSCVEAIKPLYTAAEALRIPSARIRHLG